MFEKARTAHALDRAAIVIGQPYVYLKILSTSSNIQRLVATSAEMFSLALGLTEPP
jgi:hypothetical protein